MSVETHSAVMSAMRNGNAQPPFYQQLLDEYADRAEKAHRREIDAALKRASAYRIHSEEMERRFAQFQSEAKSLQELKEALKKACDALEKIYSEECCDYGTGDDYDECRRLLEQLNA